MAVNDWPETGLVISYRFLWAREHAQGVEHGRKARPTCVVVPLTTRGRDVVLFPLTTQEPGTERVFIRVPEIERRRLRLRGSGPTWLLLDEGNRDVLPGSYHVEPIAYDPPVHAYGTFSRAFMRVALQRLAAALRSGGVKLVPREQ